MYKIETGKGGFVGGNESQAVEISELWGQGSLERDHSFGAVSWVTREGWGQISTQDDAAQQQQEEEQPQQHQCHPDGLAWAERQE